jgi:small subunit ribosomal protein S16
MSVRIRLKRMGSKKKPFYRIIASDSRMPRDGRFLETLGYYNPMTEPPDIRIHEDAVFKWFERGATPTESAASLLRRGGCLQKWDLMKAGVTGEELDMKVEAIKNQQDAAAARKQMKKKDAKSAKAAAEEASEESKAEEAAGAEPAPEKAKTEEPKVEEPVAKAEEPVAKAEEPAAKVEEPEVKVEEPEVKVEEPEVKVEEPEVKVEEPVAADPKIEEAAGAEPDAEESPEKPETK